MKILQICSYYQDGRLYEDLFDEMEDCEISEEIFFFSAEKGYRPKREGIIISQAFKWWERPFYYIKHKQVYQDLLRKVDPREFSQSHAHSLMSNGYLSYRLKEEYHLPYIVAVRNSDVNVFFKYKKYLLPLAEKILENSERIIFLSTETMRFCLSFFPGNTVLQDKAQIIPNGIDLEFFEKAPEEGKALKDVQEIKLIFIAQPVDDKNKNLRSVVKLLDLLNRTEKRKFSLSCIGKVGDKTRNQYEKKPITFLGEQNKREIIKELKKHDIFIMPSFKETFGLVYAEAMSQGLPVLYTSGQGFDGQFPEGEVGYRIPPKDIQEMKRKIQKILENYEEISKRALTNSKKFNWRDVVLEYKELYERISYEDFND